MMIELGPDFKIEISLDNSGSDQQKVLLTLPAGQCPHVEMTTQQARMLANEIIKAVTKAEVRSNLKSANHMRRNEPEAKPRNKTQLPYLVHP